MADDSGSIELTRLNAVGCLLALVTVALFMGGAFVNAIWVVPYVAWLVPPTRGVMKLLILPWGVICLLFFICVKEYLQRRGIDIHRAAASRGNQPQIGLVAPREQPTAERLPTDMAESNRPR